MEWGFGVSQAASATLKQESVAAEGSGGGLRRLGVGILLIIAALLWSYSPVVWELARDWWHNADYGVGALVPPAAAYLVWEKRKELAALRFSPCWWGLVPMASAIWLRSWAMDRGQQSLERYALVVELMGAVLLVAGFRAFRRLFWILMFLFLMAPLPMRIHNQIALPLQNSATSCAQIALGLVGVPVQRTGNVLILSDNMTLAVAEACSGLRMLTAFVIVACVMAFLVQRPAWQRGILVLSSIPIAIACNGARLVATAFLFLWTGGPWVERFFHDAAGYAMMPLALVLMSLELALLSRLVVVEEAE